MAKFSEAAQRYAEQLRSAQDKRSEAHRVIKTINGLVYTESQKELSTEDKVELAGLIRKFLVEGEGIKKAADNSEYLELIDLILNGVGGNE
ncbi:MAG: hypothetical protein P9M06_02205 [Candidatus Saelkia tenebricola]|nr:hypothetical protein [Candidatus Saelkia tenebricola]